MPYKGFDYFVYPGQTFLDNWWSGTPFYVAGFYLGPAPAHEDDSYMDKKAEMEGIGYGLIPIYVGRQSTQLTEANGRANAHGAADLAREAGFTSSQTILYLDIEPGGTLSAAFLNYIYGWADELYMATTEFWPGFYCHRGVVSQVKEKLGSSYNTRTTYWAYYPCCDVAPGCDPYAVIEPTDCGSADATLWQYARSPLGCGASGTTVTCDGKGYTDVGSDENNRTCRLTFNGSTLAVDLNVSNKRYPSRRSS